MTTALLFVAAAGLLYFFLRMKSADLSPTDARTKVDAGATLLDVRSPGEFSSGHIKGAINIPVQQLSGRLGELKGAGTAGEPEVVVYCRSGARSARAKAILIKAGHGSVSNLGPMSRWLA